MKQKHQKLNRLTLLEEFKAAPDTAWFGQATVAAIRSCSLGTVERDRWTNKGVPFIKSGRSVRYRKLDILKFLEQHTPAQSIAKKGELNHAA